MAVTSAGKWCCCLPVSWWQAVSPFWKGSLKLLLPPTFHSFWTHLCRCDHSVYYLCETPWMCPSFVMRDLRFVYTFEQTMPHWVILRCTWWKVSCTQWADQRSIYIHRDYCFLHLKTNGTGRSRAKLPHPFGLGMYNLLVLSSNSCKT